MIDILSRTSSGGYVIERTLGVNTMDDKMEDKEFLFEEYKYFAEAFWKNEEIGERRVNFFVTLATAIIGAIVALATSDRTRLTGTEARQIAIAALSATFLFGLISFLRILRRNQVTDEYKEISRYLRDQLKARSEDLAGYELPFLSKKDHIYRGGLADTVAVMNGLILAIIAWLYLKEMWKGLATSGVFLVSLGVFLVSFTIQAVAARIARQKKEPQSQSFRAGVGALIVDRRGKVLALERTDVSSAWQLPQGGLEVGEEPLEAVKREIQEETGIKENLRLLSTVDRLLAYELPKEHRSKKTGRGQVQRWFLFCYEGVDKAITLGDKKEFKAWQWMAMDELISKVVPFKKPVYQELAKDLARQLQDFRL